MKLECAYEIFREIMNMEESLDSFEDGLLKHYNDPLEYAYNAYNSFDRTQQKIRDICGKQNATFTEQPEYGILAIERYLAKMRHAVEAYKAQEAQDEVH